jgi:glycosyltransferase involved in cell wall biosynthesis
LANDKFDPLTGPTSEILVSLCIPTFNGSGFIRQTIQSCISQTHRNIEIIVSDDQSSDDTIPIIRSFDDDRIVILPAQERSNPASNWNRTINAARGEFIKILGQDDLLYPNCIEIELEALLNSYGFNPSFCFSSRSIIDDSSREIIQSRGWVPNTKICSLEDVVQKIVRTGGNPIGEPVVGLIATNAIRQTQGFTGRYLIDLNMWFELLTIGPAVHTNQTLMSFRVGKSSWSFMLKDSQTGEMLTFIKYLENSYPEIVTKFDLLVGTVLAYLKPKLRVALISIRAKK